MQQYSVVSAKNLEDVIAKVQYKLNDGWQLQGGISVARTDYSRFYYQAIVKNMGK